MKTTHLITAFLGLVLSFHIAGAETQRLLDNDSLLRVYLLQKPGGADSGADAIVLFEKGSALFKKRYDGDGVSSFKIRYKVERYLKLNTQQALGLADISVPFTKKGDLDDIDFQTINLDNGNIIREQIPKKEVLKEKLAGRIKLYKFNFRNIKPGSIIYYSFTYDIKLSPGLRGGRFPMDWSFQGEYPALESCFELIIPEEVSYRWVSRNTTFTEMKPGVSGQGDHEKTFFFNKKRGEQIHSWTRRHVPASKQENYVLNADLHTERINLVISQLTRTSDPESNVVPNTWQKANKEIYESPYLGYWIFHPQDTLSYTIDKINKGHTSNLAFARDIYRFVRDSIGETEATAPPPRTRWDLSPAAMLQVRKASHTQKNVLLTALLRKAGMESYPIILSTTSSEKLDKRYFELGAFNYLVSVVLIDGRRYLLDASSPQLPFGILKPECYNGFAWQISEPGTGVELNPDSLEERKVVMATLSQGSTAGKYQMVMEERLGNVSAPRLRESIHEDSAAVKKELEENIHKLSWKSRLQRLTILNGQCPDTSLRIVYHVELDADTTGPVMYINPFVKPLFRTNPFMATERRYPVEFGYSFDHQFILQFRIPEGYQPEEYDNPVHFQLNDYMSYKSIMSYDTGSRTLSLSYDLSSRKAVVDPGDYEALRAFYDRIITEQNKKIVLRKTP